MGLLDRWRRKAPAGELVWSSYHQKYFEDCCEIWEKYVPPRGCSEALQGELLRQIEKLRCEAQDNGNVNWDEDFVFFCDFLKDALGAQPVFSPEEKADFAAALALLRTGRPYTDDDLYDFLADAVARLHREHTQPISYVLPRDPGR